MPSQTLADFELGWLVGVLDGEGTFRYFHRSQRVAVNMGDLDTVEKVGYLFNKITGGNFPIAESYGKKLNHSIMYYICANGEDARKIMRLVVRHMSKRRRQRIWQCLNEFNQPTKGKDALSVDIVALGLVGKRGQDAIAN